MEITSVKELKESVSNGKAHLVKILSLMKCNLTKIPKEVWLLTNLEWLDLYLNNLQELPKDIGRLENLEWLDLSNNNLQTVPKEIGQLQNLEWLDLSNNNLQTVPKEIGQLQNLERLYLSNNNLQTVPKEIGQLQNLERLKITANPIPDLVLNCGGLNRTIISIKHSCDTIYTYIGCNLFTLEEAKSAIYEEYNDEEAAIYFAKVQESQAKAIGLN